MFNDHELKIILSALQTITAARTKIATEHVTKNDFQSAENVLNKQLQHEEIIQKIEQHLKRK